MALGVIFNLSWCTVCKYSHFVSSFCTLSPLSPFTDQLFDGDVSPHLSGEARERMLLLGELRVQLQSVGLGLKGDVQSGLEQENHNLKLCEVTV